MKAVIALIITTYPSIWQWHTTQPRGGHWRRGEEKRVGRTADPPSAPTMRMCFRDVIRIWNSFPPLKTESQSQLLRSAPEIYFPSRPAIATSEATTTLQLVPHLNLAVSHYVIPCYTYHLVLSGHPIRLTARFGRPGGSVNSRFDSPELQIKRADTRRRRRRRPKCHP